MGCGLVLIAVLRFAWCFCGWRYLGELFARVGTIYIYAMPGWWWFGWFGSVGVCGVLFISVLGWFGRCPGFGVFVLAFRGLGFVCVASLVWILDVFGGIGFEFGDCLNDFDSCGVGII